MNDAVMEEFGTKMVQIQTSEFYKKARLDVREQYLADGSYRSTKKGVNILLEDAPALIDAIRQVVGGEVNRVMVDADVRNPVFVQREKYRGVIKLDIRHHYDEGGVWEPTRKGVSIPFADGERFLQAVESVALVPA